MDLVSYVSFKGDCEEAFKFYEEALGAKPGLIFRYADTPLVDAIPDGWDTKVMHGSIKIADRLLEGADVPPASYEAPKGFSLSLNVPTPQEAETIFAALAVGGRIQYPIEKTFWSERFGMVVDKFGIPWMINCEVRG